MKPSTRYRFAWISSRQSPVPKKAKFRIARRSQFGSWAPAGGAALRLAILRVAEHDQDFLEARKVDARLGLDALIHAEVALDDLGHARNRHAFRETTPDTARQKHVADIDFVVALHV